ncbi:MAG: hypothetical protein DDT21_02722 [Syntrophomonadaceae bacterium]|nr:hypothetical protein [Bacillota bacterium]
MLNIVKSEKGAAIIWVLIAWIVLIMLGTAFFSIAWVENTQAMLQKRKVQAYYLARAGVEATVTDIITNRDPKLRNQIEIIATAPPPGRPIVSDSVYMGKGSFVVRITIQNNQIIVTGTGTIPGGHFNTVTATAEQVVNNPLNNAITVANNLRLDGLRDLQGIIESTNGTVTGAPQRWLPPSGTMTKTKRFLPPPSPPSIIHNLGVLDIGNNTISIAHGRHRYTKIKTGPNGILRLDTSLGDVVIVTGTLDIKGDFKVIGNGNVFIFITNPTRASELKTATHHTSNPHQLFLFLQNDVQLTVKTGQQRFHGHIYGPGAAIHLQANSQVHGSVTGNIFTAQGNPSIYHIPPPVLPPEFPNYLSGHTGFSKGFWRK